jgi:DNA-binding MarR family transcriptional regulator
MAGRCANRRAGTPAEILLANYIVMRYIGPVLPSIGPDELRALADFRFEIRRYLAFAEDAAAQAGIEPKQYQLMLAVAAIPADVATTIGAIAERLLLKHHSAVGLVDRLESKGLVARSRIESDRRQVAVQLTKRGARILEDLSVRHEEELARIAPAMVSTLTKILAQRRQRLPHAQPPGQKEKADP